MGFSVPRPRAGRVRRPPLVPEAAIPAICEGCRFYSPADAAGPCPECGKPLKFTLLPPPEFTDPADVPDELPPVRRHERDAASPGRPWVYELVTDVRFLGVAGVAAFVLLLARLWVEIARASGDPDFAPK